MIPVARPSLSDADLAAVGEVFGTRWLGLGKVTEEFENVLSARFGGRHVVATNTGTTAIELALRTVGVGEGDEVIIPSLTFVATAQAVAATGARPVLCDIDRGSLNVTVESLEIARSPATKAVIPVHYRGLPAEIDPIVDWARGHGIRVIEDAAHAFGSDYEDGTAVGAKGDVTCFSFDPIKNITTGEGGAVLFDDEEEHARAARLRVLGIDSTAWSRLEARRPWEYDVVDIGFRFHMPNFCAAIGLSQLDRFEQFRTVKRSVLRRYQDALRDHPALEIPELPVDRCFPFLALVLVDERERFMAHMREKGVGTGVHYQPLHRLSRFADNAANGVTVSEELGERICSIPLLADQTDAECERVLEAAASFH
jgi:dTDP-4-amino-4,6-dideoxygalactose transaminase